MSAPDDPEMINAEVEVIKTQVAELAGISDDDWRAYVRVSKILGTITGGAQLVDDGSEDVAFAAAAAGSAVSLIRLVHKCAMVGLFEPEPGSDTSGVYDPAAVQRFADLGG